MIVPGILVCSSFLISVCMFIVSKALLISSATVFFSRRGSHLAEPPSTGLFNVCSAVTIECCVLYTWCVGVFDTFSVMYKRMLFPSVFAITEMRGMGLYEVSLSMSLLGFWMGTILAKFHMCGIMLLLRAVFNMLVRNTCPRGPMYFRCLMFSLSGP